MFDIIARWNRWGGATLAGGTKRDTLDELHHFLNTKEIIALIGPRRAGKTTILFQIMDLLEEKGVPPEAFLHVNFEEPAFSSELNVNLLENIYNSYREQIFPKGKAYLFFDEIQNVASWERWARARNDTENIKIFVTGSSSKLMSRELGTLLTGRHISFKIFPLSFKEFLRFEKIEQPKQKTFGATDSRIKHALNKYLKWGGFPEVALSHEEHRKELLLRQYFDDILFKDIAMRHSIRDVATLRTLAVHLLTHTASLISSQRISKLFGISLDMAKAYCSHLEEAFLVGFVPYWSSKIAERNRNPQKVHAFDLGLRQIVSLAQSKDKGHIIETAVYHKLTRQTNDGIFYWKEKNEIDFVIRKANAIQKIIQVVDCSAKDIKLLPRETDSLKSASKKFPKAEKIIIANQASHKQNIGAKKDIQLIPLWYFLL